jgi:broad specificity phosphatase PhoE
MTEIYFVRHAEVKKNVFFRILQDLQSQYPEIPFLNLANQFREEINPRFNAETGSELPKEITLKTISPFSHEFSLRGLEQPSKLAEKLSYLKYKNPFFLTSPSTRAVETAENFVRGLGLNPNQFEFDDESFLNELGEHSITNPQIGSLTCRNLQTYLEDLEIDPRRPIVIVSHQHRLTALHKHLHPETPEDLRYSNCGLTIAEYNPHLRIIHPHRTIEELK